MNHSHAEIRATDTLDCIPVRLIAVQALTYSTYDPHPVLQFDTEGLLLWSNQAARDLAHRHGLHHLTELLQEARASENSDLGASYIESEVGERIFRWALVREPKENAVFAYGVEVTDLTRCERRLQQAQKLELLGESSASIAHDFNDYLTGIMNELELALHNDTAEAERQDSIMHAVRACHHAARTVRMLLDFSRQREPRLETK